MDTNTKRGTKKHFRGRDGENVSIGSVVANAFVGAGAALIAMLTLAAVSGGLCMLSNDPAALTLPVGIAIFILTSALGGAVCGARFRKDKTAALFSGCLCGFSLMIFLGIGAILQTALAPEATHGLGLLGSVLIRAAALPLSGIAAFLTASKRKNKRHRRR